MKIKNKNGRYLGRDLHESESRRRTVHASGPLTKVENELFTLAYREGKAQDLSGNDLVSFLSNLLIHDDRFGMIAHCALDLDELGSQIERCEKNVFNRISRFENICYLNKYNYFVTLTYDSDKINDEAVFRRKIRKTLSNMAFRFGWLYKGVFERGEEGNRLHVHLLLRAEEGGMPGELVTRAQYSTKRRRMEFVTANTFFDKFGRNEFRAIDSTESGYGRTIRYLAKYIGKSGERLFGSKNLTHELVREVDTEKEVMYVEQSFGTVYVLFQSLFQAMKEDGEAMTLEVKDSALIDWYFVNPQILHGFADRLAAMMQADPFDRIE